MSTSEVINDSIAPLIQRILADPLQFKQAKLPDQISNKPSSYTLIGPRTASNRSSRSALQPQQPKSPNQERGKDSMARTRITSFAQALASYTGKRSIEDSNERNRELKKSKNGVIEANDEDVGEDFEAGEGERDNTDDASQEMRTSPISDNDNVEDGDYEQSREESSSTDDYTNYTDAEDDPLSRSLVSKKVYKKLQGRDESNITTTASSTDAEGNDDDRESLSDSNDSVDPLSKCEYLKSKAQNGHSTVQDQVSEDDDDDDEDEEYRADEDEDGFEDDDDDDSDDDDDDDDIDDDDDDNGGDQDFVDAQSGETRPHETEMKKQLLDDSQKALSLSTTPESDEEVKEVKLNGLGLDQFYGIGENPNDRGSNGSERIIKNWGPTLSGLKPLGLLNHGVTCYTNAAVQAMIHIPAVEHYLLDVLKHKYSGTIGPRSVTNVLAETSARMWNLDALNQKRQFINPKKLIGRLEDINCMMSEWQQEDSHEYFMSLLSRLQEDGTPKGAKLNSSIIYDIFGGLLSQSVTCKNCGHISKTQQEFYDLSLHLGPSRKSSSISLTPEQQEFLLKSQNDPNSIATLQKEISQQNNEQNSKPQRYSITKSIKDFFSQELIKADKSDKSGYVCESCKKRTNAIKISRIQSAPETLTVHLKRFRFNGTSSSKVKQGVSYPLYLNLTHYTTTLEPVVYQLISVVVHEGRSVSSGHYVAHCRQPDGTWATYDDEYINVIPEKQALRDPSAYYLIYTRLTHKDVAASKSAADFNTSTTASTPQKNDAKRSAPSSPISYIAPAPASDASKNKNKNKNKNSKQKQKLTGLRPTNNLGNINGSSHKKYSKTGTKQSKRFRKY